MPSLLLNGLIIIGSLSQLSISVDQEGDGQQAGGQPASNPAHHCGSGPASEREQAAGEVQHAVHHRPSEVPGGFAGAGTELEIIQNWIQRFLFKFTLNHHFLTF